MKQLTIVLLALFSLVTVSGCATPKASAASAAPNLADTCFSTTPAEKRADAALFYGQDYYGFFILHDFTTLGNGAYWRLPCSEDEAFALDWSIYVADQTSVKIAPMDIDAARAKFNAAWEANKQ